MRKGGDAAIYRRNQATQSGGRMIRESSRLPSDERLAMPTELLLPAILKF